MPTYAYACTACDHRFDAQQSFTDAALTECPECTGRLRKLFGSVGVVFKGSGFYRTDSRTSPSAPSTASSTASSSTGSASGSGEGSSSTSSSGTSTTSSSTPSTTASSSAAPAA